MPSTITAIFYNTETHSLFYHQDYECHKNSKFSKLQYVLFLFSNTFYLKFKFVIHLKTILDEMYIEQEYNVHLKQT